jgi:hypothetical protein
MDGGGSATPFSPTITTPSTSVCFFFTFSQVLAISLPTMPAFLNWFLGARDFPACQIKPYMAPCGPLISGSFFLCASIFSVNRTVL